MESPPVFKKYKINKIMGLKPGQTNNPAGRKPGVPNKANRPLKDNISNFLQSKWVTIEKDFKKLEPRDRVLFYEKLLSYTLPRLKSVDATVELTQKLDGLSDQQLHALIDKILEEDPI